MAMANVRELTRQSECGVLVSLLNDDQVIEKLTHMLHTGRWRICHNIEARPYTPGPGARTEAEPPPPPRRQPVVRPPVVNVPEVTTFPGHHDPLAQAAALTDSAVSGVPFCAECEKLRQQKAASARQETH